MSNPVFSRSECLSQYRWGDDCHGWNFVDTDALSVKQELMPPDTAEQLHYHEKATQLFFILKTLIGRENFMLIFLETPAMLRRRIQ